MSGRGHSKFYKYYVDEVEKIVYFYPFIVNVG